MISYPFGSVVGRKILVWTSWPFPFVAGSWGRHWSCFPLRAPPSSCPRTNTSRPLQDTGPAPSLHCGSRILGCSSCDHICLPALHSCPAFARNGWELGKRRGILPSSWTGCCFPHSRKMGMVDIRWRKCWRTISSSWSYVGRPKEICTHPRPLVRNRLPLK